MNAKSSMLDERKPEREKRTRKAIELEFKEPVNVKVLSPEDKKITEKGFGEVLALNDQGMLLLTGNRFKEGSFISLSIKFKGLGPVEGILGKIKKVEESEQHDYYVGIELCSPEKIKAEALSGLFPEETESFNTRLKKSLMSYFKHLQNSKEEISSSKQWISY